MNVILIWDFSILYLLITIQVCSSDSLFVWKGRVYATIIYWREQFFNSEEVFIGKSIINVNTCNIEYKSALWYMIHIDWISTVIYMDKYIYIHSAMHGLSYIEASEPKWVKSVYILYEVNSLRLGGLYINIYDFKKFINHH